MHTATHLTGIGCKSEFVSTRSGTEDFIQVLARSIVVVRVMFGLLRHELFFRSYVMVRMYYSEEKRD